MAHFLKDFEKKKLGLILYKKISAYIISFDRKLDLWMWLRVYLQVI